QAFSSSYEWSPYSSKFVFECGGLCTINVDGSERKQITNPGFAVDVAPRWSPDASKIAFQRYYSDEYITVLVVNADGSSQKEAGKNAGSQVWSPDGARIAFIDAPDYRYSYLYVMNADTSGVT